MKFKNLSLLALSLFLFEKNVLNAQNSVATKKEKYEANWQSLRQYKVPDWFRDAKFGIFIHWGVYSVPAYGSEWYPRMMYSDSIWSPQGKLEKAEASDVYKHHIKTWGPLDKFGYKDFVPMFKAEKFDANEWVSLFKEAGAKYVVPVAEHHDGFAMYNSSHTRWNSVNMGPKRDVAKEIAEAVKKNGLKFGLSSHYAFNWSYYNKKEGFDTNDPQFEDLYGRKHAHYADMDNTFQKHWWNRTKEIIDNYKPDILWFDFYLDRPEMAPYHPKLAAYYYNKGVEWNKSVVLQDKNFNYPSFPQGIVVYDVERGSLSATREDPWQTDTSIGENSWSYVSNWISKTPNRLIDDLIDIVSKNGNLLLNIGPKADGTIPEDQKQVLLEIGKWLKVNGEAIYGTRPWKSFGEGPTQISKGHHSEGKNKAFTSEDFRFTQKGDVVYAIALDWAKDGKFLIKSLGEKAGLVKTAIKNVQLVGGNNKLKWEQEKEGLEIKVDGNAPTDYATVFKITFKK